MPGNATGSLSAAMDCLDCPAALLDPGLTLLASNTLLDTLCVEHGQVRPGARIGDVLDCIHASAPGPCSETRECPLCVLRRLVLLASFAGAGVRHVTCSLHQASGRTRWFKVSSLPTDRGALLTVEPAHEASGERRDD